MSNSIKRTQQSETLSWPTLPLPGHPVGFSGTTAIERTRDSRDMKAECINPNYTKPFLIEIVLALFVAQA